MEKSILVNQSKDKSINQGVERSPLFIRNETMENVIIKSLVNEIERLYAQINDQKQTIVSLSDEVDSFQSICHDQSENIEKSAGLEELCREQEKTISECTTYIESLEKRFKEFKKSAVQSYTDLQCENEKLKLEIERLHTVKEYEDTILTKKLDEALEGVTHFRHKSYSLGCEVEEHELKIEQLELELEEACQNVEDLQEQIEHLEEYEFTIEELVTVCNMSDTITKHEKTISDHEKTISDQSDTITEHEKTISDHEKTISDHEETISDQYENVKYLEKILSASADDVEKTCVELAEAKSKVKNMARIAHLLLWLLREPDSVEQTVDGDSDGAELVKFVNGKRKTKWVTHEELRRLGVFISWVNDIEIIYDDRKSQSEPVTAYETGCWD